MEVSLQRILGHWKSSVSVHISLSAHEAIPLGSAAVFRCPHQDNHHDPSLCNPNCSKVLAIDTLRGGLQRPMMCISPKHLHPACVPLVIFGVAAKLRLGSTIAVNSAHVAVSTLSSTCKCRDSRLFHQQSRKRLHLCGLAACFGTIVPFVVFVERICPTTALRDDPSASRPHHLAVSRVCL